MAKKKDLAPKQHKALMALAVGKSIGESGKIAKVTSRTMSNWMKDEDFREELRTAMERMRQQFESRIMQVANNAAVVVQEMLVSPSVEVRAKGANLALNAAVRLSTRYKELQVEGYVPPPRPMIIFPEGTKAPWMAKALAPAPAQPEHVVDVEAIEVAKE